MQQIDIDESNLDFKISDKIKDLLRPLNDSEYSYLRESLEEEGCREPLIIWKEKNILLDGHHRLSLCRELDIEYEIEYKRFSNKNEAFNWVIKNQLAKRNLNDRRYQYLVGKRYLEEKKEHSGTGANQYTVDKVQSGQNVHSAKTAEKIAEKEGVDEKTVRRNAGFAKSVDKITKNVGRDFQIKAIDEETIPKNVTKEIAEVGEKDQQKIFDLIKKGREIREKDMKEYKKSQDKVKDKAISYIEDGDNITLKDAITRAKRQLKKDSKKTKTKSTFNETNDKIEWAKWSWNPVTGCKGPGGDGPCKYCYARDIANRFYDEGFKPTFRPERLDAPKNTKIPKSRKDESGIKNVFVCSMGDLFGDWVPEKWIDRTLESTRKYDNWNYLFLTKNPSRLPEIDFPDNSWVGATVEVQKRVESTIENLPQVNAPIKFISSEPLMEKIRFPEGSLSEIDWIIIGGRSKSSKMKAAQPKWEWVESLLRQARKGGCKIYFKPNLKVRPKEYPGENASGALF